MKGLLVKLPEWRTQLVSELPAAVALFDPDLRYVAASAAWSALFDLAQVALVGRRHNEFAEKANDAVTAVLQRALAGETVEKYPVTETEPAGKLSSMVLNARAHRDPDGTIVGALVAVEQARVFGGEDAAALLLDPLTGIAGRLGFIHRLGELLSGVGAANRPIAVLVVDIDSFRSLNNLHGVGIGDQVLKITAQRLMFRTREQRPDDEATTGQMRRRDFVARLGADQFGVILGTQPASLAELEALADRLLRVLESPIAINELNIGITASIGFLVTSAVHRDENDVLRDLDLALREGKSRGPNRATAWQPALTRIAVRRYTLAEELRRALDAGEFTMHYQPIFRLADGRLVGAEALLRWNHPSDGLVSPGTFIPLLEETALIIPVGCWAVHEAVRQMQSWRLLYGRDIIDWVSINVSARQFHDPSALLSAFSEVYESGFPLQRLMLEITETSLMRDPEATRNVLAELQNLGIRIAIDDFGTGYSSLAAFQHYRADAIKIDAGFVARIDSADGGKLATALLNIARIPGADVIAEGIETAAQRDFLHANGCHFGQGYLFARPMEGGLFGTYALTGAAERISASNPSPGSPSAPGRHSGTDSSA
jgi:diguanylate cyclase (GGDEF)-like protein